MREGDAGTTVARFGVSLSEPSRRPVSVSYRTRNLTALAGQDYRRTTGALMFRPGQTRAAIAILIIGDTVFERDETFALDLFNPRGISLDRRTAVGTIVNDDRAVVDVAAIASPTSVLAHPDEELSLELGAMNAGSAAVTNVIVDITAPGAVVLEAPAECVLIIDPIFRCPLGTLSAGQSHGLAFRLRYVPEIRSAIEVHAIGDGDTSPGNDTLSVPVTIGLVLSDVMPSATPASSAVHPGDTIDFQFSVTNGGIVTATDMVLDTVPNAAVLAAPPECELLVNVYRCPIGTLAARETQSLAFTLAFLHEGSFSIDLHAYAAHDIDPDNDEHSVPVTSAAVLADVSPTSTPASASGHPGDSIDFTFGAINTGSDPATDVALDFRPGGAFVLAAPATCELITFDLYRCLIGTLQPGEAGGFTFTLGFPRAGSYFIELHAIAQDDIDPGNDELSVPVTIE